MSKIAFLIFSHCEEQNVDDVNDMIENISYFHDDCDFFINHPTIEHQKIKTRHKLGTLNNSSFIFGAFEKMIKSLTIKEINNFDHFVLVSANQYFINKLILEKNVNYVQFYNVENWDSKYTGKNFSTKYEGFPIKQPYGLWDPKKMYEIFGIKNPMASNWECATLTKDVMILCKDNIDTVTETYPNADLISVFPGYMVLKSNQVWKFPSFFGTYDPSNKIKNSIIKIEQIDEKLKNGYSSVKRVNYSKDCQLKNYIRKNIMNK